MKRLLKNDLRQHLKISGFPRQKDEVWFKSKSSRVFDMDIKSEADEYYKWLERFGPHGSQNGFVRDITKNVKPYNQQPEII